MKNFSKRDGVFDWPLSALDTLPNQHLKSKLPILELGINTTCRFYPFGSAPTIEHAHQIYILSAVCLKDHEELL